MNSMKAFYIGTILALSMIPTSTLSAQDNPVISDTVVSGEVTKVDLTTGKITIRHGPINSLGMSAAEAVDDFQANEPIMLNAVGPGDKITFTADRVNGQPTIAMIVTPK